jgi:hypothetical protein
VMDLRPPGDRISDHRQRPPDDSSASPYINTTASRMEEFS